MHRVNFSARVTSRKVRDGKIDNFSCQNCQVDLSNKTKMQIWKCTFTRTSKVEGTFKHLNTFLHTHCKQCPAYFFSLHCNFVSYKKAHLSNKRLEFFQLRLCILSLQFNQQASNTFLGFIFSNELTR